MMASQAASNTGAPAPATQAQPQSATEMQAASHAIIWDPSGGHLMGTGGAHGLPLAHSNPQPIETLDERELKRLRRKQNNRESARRSRQRKADEITQLTDQVTKRDSHVLLLQETVKVLAQHVKDLSKQVKECGGIVDPSVEAASDVSHVITQTTECPVDASQSIAEVSDGVPREPDEQEPVLTHAVPIDQAVPGMRGQSIDTATQPATGM